jgi:hypothetical protein
MFNFYFQPQTKCTKVADPILGALRNCPERNNPDRNIFGIFLGSSPSLVPFPLA